jgi:hypothetical protein
MMLNEFMQVVQNNLSYRRTFLDSFSDPRRDLNKECGYPETVDQDPWKYQDLFDRDPIANRVIEVLPKECWQSTPEVTETKDSEEETQFEKSWKNLGKEVRGQSFYQDEKGSVIWEYLRRADILSGIGQFGIVLLGIDDGLPLAMPANGMNPEDLAGPSGAVSFGLPQGADRQYWLPIATQGYGYGGYQQPGWENPQPLQPYGTPGKFGYDIAGNPIGGSSQMGAQLTPTGYMPGQQASPLQADPLPYTDPQYQGNPQGNPNLREGGAQIPPPGQVGVPSSDSRADPSISPPGGSANSNRRKSHLLFVRVFPESLVRVTQYETNVLNPRFGQPVQYLITLNDPRIGQAGIGLTSATVNVHWTRCIHIADNRTSSEVFGVPRCQPVLNRLLDLQKLYGGSAEMYWKGAFPGISMETNAALGGDVDIDPELEDQLEAYMNGLQRYLQSSGMTAKSLAVQVSDPASQIDKALEAITIKIPCPMRVFKGTERGELASSQDDSKWNDIVRGRCENHVTPCIVVAFIDRLIWLGVLPQPKGYSVTWPDLDSLSDAEKSSIALQQTQTLGTYLQDNISELMDPMNFFTHIMGFKDDVAKEIIENMQQYKQEQQEQQQPTQGSYSAADQGLGANHPNPPDDTTTQPLAYNPQDAPPTPNNPAQATSTGHPLQNTANLYEGAVLYYINNGNGTWSPITYNEGHGKGSGIPGPLPGGGSKGTIVPAIRSAYEKAKSAAALVGKSIYDKLDTKTQEDLKAVHSGYSAIEHYLDKPLHAAQALVNQTIKERGLPDSHADKVAHIVAAVDGIGKWTANVPGAHAAIHALEIATGGAGVALSKVGALVPVGSLAYLAYSTLARNPLATVRAAYKLVSGKVQSNHPTTTPAAMSTLLSEGRRIAANEEMLAWNQYWGWN